MGHNGHATSSQDLTIVPCAACGLPANLNSGHVVVEFKKGGVRRTLFAGFGTVVVTMSL